MLWELRDLDTGEVEYQKDFEKSWRHRFVATRLDGRQCWYKKELRHRLDGPAVIWEDGDQWWYKEGKCHRLDGPAITYADGSERWFIEGKKVKPCGN